MRAVKRPAWQLSTSWQYFLAIAGVGLVLVVISLFGIRLYFTHNFNHYLSAQEEQRLHDLALVIADYYEVQSAQDPEFTLAQLDDLQRGGVRRLLAGLSMAQWRQQRGETTDGAQPESMQTARSLATRFSFRGITLYDAQRQIISGRPAQLPISVAIVAGTPVRTIGYLETERPQGPLQPIDSVFQQQQLSALLFAGAATIVLAAVVAALLARTLRRRVRTVTTITRHLAQGQYEARVAVRGADDLAQLGTDVNALARALQSASAERRAFMADIAHELRTPLTVLQAELEAIEDGVRSLDVSQMGLLQHQVRSLTQLVDDLHTLAEADAGSLSYRWEQIDLAQWVQGQWPGMSRQAESSGLVANLAVPTISGWVQADEVRLGQLLSNLWSNSLRYTDTPGQLSVTVKVTDTDVVLIVEDSAPGLNPTERKRIFDRLYRVESSRSRQFGGSGLGLAIAKRIAHAHAATLVAQDSELGGVRMVLSLPRAAVKPPANLV